MSTACEVASHPQGQVTGRVIRESAKAVYQERDVAIMLRAVQR